MNKHFKYQAYDNSGTKVKGVVAAADVEKAEEQLLASKYSILSIKEVNTHSYVNSSKIKSSDLELFTSELSLLLKSGVRLDSALAILSEGVENKALSLKLLEILDDVRGGVDLMSALKKSQLFDVMYCEMVGVGESTGKLSDVFIRLARNMKFRRDLRNKISQASVYPMFILFVCISAILGIFNFIVPTMGSLFDGVDEIPAATALLLSASDYVIENQYLWFATLFVLVIAIYRIKDKPWFKNKIITLCHKIPLISGLFLLSERINYASTMHLMLSSGVALEVAMRLSANVVRHPNLQGQLLLAREQVSQGIPLSGSLSKVDIIEPLMMSLVRVGEETGELDVVFERIAERAKETFEGRIIKLTSLLEPVLIVSMGLIVGSVVVTMLLSIVSINDVSL